MSKLIYLMREGFRNLWRHKLTALTAIGSVFASLLIIGIFILIHQNSHQLIESVRSKYKIEVFFDEKTSAKNAAEIIDEIKRLNRIKSVEFISKDEALQIYQNQFDENLIELLGYNPLPYSAVVELDQETPNGLNVEPIIDELENLQHVDEVVYEGTLISRIENFYKTALRVISYIGLGFLLITIIVISNTVKLSVYAKQELISSLKSIGATKLFIKTPFIIEGILEGLIGAILTFAVLFVTVRSINTFFNEIIQFKIEFDVLAMLWLLVIAFIIGLIGSYRGIRILLR